MLRRTAVLSLPLLAQGLFRSQALAQATTKDPAKENHSLLISRPAFEKLPQRIEKNYPDVESVVVVRNDEILFEHYKSGTGPDTLRDIQSVTKSILSMAVGAALGKGTVRSVDQLVSEMLPSVRLPDAFSESSALTIRHLLTMTAGFKLQERFALDTADDPDFLMRRQRTSAPGANFAYDNLAANLLSVALEGATGKVTSQFTEQSLFLPLGINVFDWQNGLNGHSYGFSGLRMRTQDMAKLGQLALHAGNWRGNRIIPEEYARSAVTAQNPGGRPVGLAYGYMWWVVPSAAERRTFLASGWGGQFIWVHQPLDLVIAMTSAISEDTNGRGQALALIRNELFRAAASTNQSTQ